MYILYVIFFTLDLNLVYSILEKKSKILQLPFSWWAKNSKPFLYLWLCDVKEFLFFVIFYFTHDLNSMYSNFGEIFHNFAITFSLVGNNIKSFLYLWMCDVKDFLFFVIYFTLDLILAGSNFGEIFNNLAITFLHGGIDIVNHMLAVLPSPL